MPCGNCGSTMEPVDIPEPSESGHFVEHWRCVNCKAREYISGNEEEPAVNWDHWGSAVQEN